VNLCSTHHGADLPVDFDRLPQSQAARWRHRCAACAYALGRRHREEVEERLRARVRELTAKVQALVKSQGRS
jgi:uncharacterized protein with PIN domain